MEGSGAAAGRGLSALLAGRAKKQTCELRNAQELQEAALRLLNCHQNLSELLLEVGSSECDKPLYSCGSCASGHEESAPESFVVPALQEEASMLGVPLGVLSARTAATNIEKISAESGTAVLLNAEQRKKLSCLLQTLRDLLARNAFCRLLFAQALWRMRTPLILELAWHLHREGILSLEELLENHPDTSALADWLCSSLRVLCQQAEDSPVDTETLQGILTDFGVMFLHNGFQKTSEMGRKSEPQPVLSKICCAVLEGMLAWALDTAAKEKQEDASTLRAVKCWLGVFSLMASRGTVPSESLQQFFSHNFTRVLTYNPQLKVSDAIRMQREWSFARNSSLLTTLYQKLFVVLRAEELTGHLQQVLEANEVNWHHVLSCISTLLVCYAEAEQLVKDLLDHLLRRGFENYDLESLITAFLIARQAAFEGPALFMSYPEWFKLAFGSAGGFHGSSKKAVVFLFKFLSELVPFEAPQYLKVHIMHPPFVPAKYRPFLLEYITLAKTRLADFKVAIEDMGLYEDLSSTKDALQPHCQALQDVEKAVQIFENTGKIPAVVLEASVFRRPYYISRFLPALLMPRLLPETPDSHMALIDALKRAEKIPLNTYSKFIEECQSVKEKFLHGGCPGTKTGDLKGPLELLKAELEALRRLVTDQSMQDALPAQVAVISEKLAGVLGRRKDEEEAASLSLRIKLNLSVPEVQQQDQEVVDLLLTAFCQNVMAASYFSPPDRQGVWPSLFVKMVCGHQQFLPSLLSRLCQLIYHQGPSLSDAHIIGLAVFVVHLNEAKSLLPEVDICSWAPHGVTTRGLPVAELWGHLLPCRTGESMIFCMRFCTAAVSYFLCKFSSFSHEFLCTSLHPGFVKKLQYVVPRLSVEARGTSCGGDVAEFLWKSLFRSAVCYQKTVLCLWKQTRFKKLLQEKMFQLTLQEWVLMELGVHPDEDALSASERQEFHYWALYQQYLPASAASGGCEGDLQEACAVLIGSILDFCQRSELSNCRHLEKPKPSVPRLRGSPEIHCRLQEMLLEVELERRRAPPNRQAAEKHFLFRMLQERMKALGPDAAEGERLLREQELILQTRILLGLPPSLLITTQWKGKEIALDCEDFFCFVNTGLKNVCSRGYALSYDITAHFFRGLLSASLECNRPAQEVTAILGSCQARCPILLCSAARWWCKLEPVLCCEWKRLFTVPLEQGLQRLKELQHSVHSFLSSEASSLVSDVPWLSAAFLHFTIQQQQTACEKADALKRLGPGAEQLLGCLLFFSIVDFISARLAPQEGMDVPRALDWSSQIARQLEEQGPGWLAVFRSGETEHGLDQILRDAVSDQHRRQLPVAFYSLLFTLHPERLVREPMFLSVAVNMYTQLLQLFAEGTAAVRVDPAESREHNKEPEDPLAVIQAARQFLVLAIPQCPLGSFSHLHQFLDLCGELDPELKAALTNCWQPTVEGSLSDEELLLF